MLPWHQGYHVLTLAYCRKRVSQHIPTRTNTDVSARRSVTASLFGQDVRTRHGGKVRPSKQDFLQLRPKKKEKKPATSAAPLYLVSNSWRAEDPFRCSVNTTVLQRHLTLLDSAERFLFFFGRSKNKSGCIPHSSSGEKWPRRCHTTAAPTLM